MEVSVEECELELVQLQEQLQLEELLQLQKKLRLEDCQGKLAELQKQLRQEELHFNLVQLQQQIRQSTQQLEAARQDKQEQEDNYLQHVLVTLCPVPETTRTFAMPPGHLCSICYNPMLDPVCTQLGHTYDRECIQGWFQSGKQTNPICGQALQSTLLVNNIALRQSVESWLSNLEPFRSSPRESWDRLIKRHVWEEHSGASHRLNDVGPSTPSVPLQNSGTGLKEGDTKFGPKDAEAQYLLGLRYEKGEGVEKDLTKAYEWFQKSAEQGSRYGQWMLACCYERGQGVAKNRAEAFKWYRKSAAQGYALAQERLFRNGL